MSLKGSRLVFDFAAKGAQQRTVVLDDPTLAKAIGTLRRCRSGSPRLLICRSLRTWHATLLAAVILAGTQPPRSKRATSSAEVAEHLGNMPAVARRPTSTRGSSNSSRTATPSTGHYDRRGPATNHPPFRLVLCGSAISVMSTLLAGDQALRGRAALDLRLGPFRYRDAAAYWRCEPATALLVDAVLGGAPGYRDIANANPKGTPAGFFNWLERTLLNPSHALFAEPDYLLAEDPRIGDRAIYHAIWEAVSAGASTPTQIGGLVGMDAKSLTYHLRLMRDAGFLRYDQDMLLQRRPVITVADPAVRFHNLIVRPNLIDLEMRQARAAWERSQASFSARILGPHFEELAREWVRWYGRERGLDDVGPVGTTQVSCREHRGHEIDVVALGRSVIPRSKGARITVIGEAKSTNERLGLAELERLGHIRELLTTQGWDAAGATLALFSRTGFVPDLVDAARKGDVHLVDLHALYGTA